MKLLTQKHTMTLQLLGWPLMLPMRTCLWVFLPNIFPCVTPSHPSPGPHFSPSSLDFWFDSNGSKIKELGFGSWFQLCPVDSWGWVNQLSLKWWYIYPVSRVVYNLQAHTDIRNVFWSISIVNVREWFWILTTLCLELDFLIHVIWPSMKQQIRIQTKKVFHWNGLLGII